MMSESFWWNLLAGFLIGFVVSTLWEWLYFRRRRMAIRNRRIDELEATVRTYAAASGAARSDAVAADDWDEPQFDNPHVYLETEEPAPPARPDDLPHSTPAPTSYPTAYGASRDNAAPHPNRQTAPQPSGQTTAATQRAGFQSVAVQQPVMTNDGAPVEAAESAAQVTTPDEPPDETASVAAAPVHQANDEDRSAITKTAAVITAAAAAPYLAEEAKQPAAQSDSAPSTHSPAAAGITAINTATAPTRQSPTEPSDLSKASTTMHPSPTKNGRAAYNANGRIDQTYPEAARQPDETPSPGQTAAEMESSAQTLAAVTAAALAATADTVAADALAESSTSKPITSSDLDALAASINDLLETVNKQPPAAQPSLPRAGQPTAQEDSPYTTRITGRTEFVLVRLVQTVVQFFRQVRVVLSGEDAEKPAIYTSGALATDDAAARDELTKISGLTQAHAERLRVGGINTFAQVAALSTDELRLITFTPSATPADYTRWRAEAAQFAATSQRVRVS